MHPALRLLTICTIAGALTHASAQADSTATRAITPSVFVGGTAVETGLASGRNLSITAGLDISFRPDSTLQPSFEYRAMYAIDKGGIDSIKNHLIGIKLARHSTYVRPYVDLLAGRGETAYANGGFQVPNKPIFYTLSASNVFCLGGGADLFTTGHLALKLDFQIQRYSSPVTVSGSLYSETGTAGVVYVFRLGRHPR